jgi:hypothetical protein
MNLHRRFPNGEIAETAEQLFVELRQNPSPFQTSALETQQHGGHGNRQRQSLSVSPTEQGFAEPIASCAKYVPHISYATDKSRRLAGRTPFLQVMLQQQLRRVDRMGGGVASGSIGAAHAHASTFRREAQLNTIGLR